jgi:hypothetical protein
MKAKTYKSTNGFTAPQSLSDFGIEVSNGKETKHLGLEEFNFCPILQEYSFKGKNTAFLPCFSIDRAGMLIEKLELFYLYAPKVTFHYATLYGVTQIQTSEITAIRKDLISVGLPAFVRNSIDFQNNYGPLFQPAVEIWNTCFNTDVIIAGDRDDRFILNTFYERVEHHNPKRQVDWANLMFANNLYN